MAQIEDHIRLLNNSTTRLMKAFAMPEDDIRPRFIRRESWISLKRAWGLWWHTFRKGVK